MRGVVSVTPDPAPQVTFEQLVASGKYSNEELIYLFLTQEMNLNCAAACGILANIKAESSFRPTAYNSSGGSYGICQWTGSRKTRLQNYCKDAGLDYTTLTGQLYYLEYELENHYTKTLTYIRGVENSAQGAYDAGYYWCYNFEVPANRESRSRSRGETAARYLLAQVRISNAPPPRRGFAFPRRAGKRCFPPSPNRKAALVSPAAPSGRAVLSNIIKP